jgi:cytochrome c
MIKSVIAGAAIAALTLVAPEAASAQDARRGEHVFRKCLLCHVLDPAATNAIAPPLHNVIGRKAAEVTGFAYSDIMKLAREKGLVWNAEALFYFLDRPEDFMPGTFMAFAGLEEQERKDVIAYLSQITEAYQARQKSQSGAVVPFSAPKAMAPIKVEPKNGAPQPSAPTAKSKPAPPRP